MALDHLILPTLMVVVLLVTPGCTLVQLLIPPENLKVLPPKEFAAAITKEDVLLVDVHTPEQAHIKGTDHFIPYDEVGQHLASFPASRSTPIYLYCKSGHMINVSARTLFEHGYTNVYNLGGGTQAWLEAGFTVEE